ncbi:NAD(P)H-hydrate dehydratase [Kangiella spongicola]|uniref:Bifunctional NAD(P)H-hydrate repair enzyme n=1 Tax=Kangiella spongicola TaxID=796379 RepID=A0A318D8B2_9GAMM|nr:NAD(P)H-hydrate dehydratase [Kangiella spongicola]PXF63444.1 bifunctional ADP-dependent NAD(P)H-hydrate dehydratase/NAD(P)H-hydrate epimerase [Kangiella spongicola]
MQPLFSVDSIKRIERSFVKQEGIELYELMQRAGASAFEQARRLWPQASHWIIATGAGNNAGDGLVVARHALLAGFDVTLVSLKPYSEFKGDPQKAWQELLSIKKDSHQSFDILGLEQALDTDLSSADLVVDALLGTGVKGELKDEYCQILSKLNSLSSAKVALDIPTGIYADSGLCATKNGQNTVFRADATVSFVALKTGQRLNQALQYQGELILETLGVRHALSFGEEPEAYCSNLQQLKEKLPTRHDVGSKFDCGHALLIGGGAHLGGAVILAASAALKSGAGMVSGWIHHSQQVAGLSVCPEIMWRGYNSHTDFQELADLSRYQAVGFGPGLGRDSTAEQIFLDVITKLQTTDIPCVLDADGLYWLSKYTSVPLPVQSVLTPHAGEACRLLNAQEEDVFSTGRIEPQLSVDTAYVTQNRIKVAQTLAKKYSAICVLKGAGTVLSNGEETIVLAGAHAAMMTAGLGDVLTGLITSFIVQGAKPLDAALLATQIHYEAAISAAGERRRGVTASEVIEASSKLINQLDQANDRHF